MGKVVFLLLLRSYIGEPSMVVFLLVLCICFCRDRPLRHKIATAQRSNSNAAVGVSIIMLTFSSQVSHVQTVLSSHLCHGLKALKSYV